MKRCSSLDALRPTLILGFKILTLIIVTNLTDMELTENKVSVLKYGLKHRFLNCPKESVILVVVEDSWDEILCHDVFKEDHISKHYLQTVLKAFTYKT